MVQNEMEGRPAASAADRFWRIDLNRPGPWRAFLLVIVGFAIGAACGLVFS